MDNNTNTITVPVNLEYELELTDKTLPKYTMTQRISQWLHDNLESLVDDEGHNIFNKINYGFSDDNLRNFGNQPVCDVYINRIDYDPSFEDSKPMKVHTIIIFYFKGANNKSYIRLCELHDYIMQEFASNNEFQTLPGIIRDTYIENSRLMTQPISKQWGVMGTFELTHILF